MATLQGRAIKDTYKDLLQVSNSNAGVDATLRTVEDGEGTSSALQVSTGGAKINGTLEVTDKINGIIDLSNDDFVYGAHQGNLNDTGTGLSYSAYNSSDPNLANAEEPVFNSTEDSVAGGGTSSFVTQGDGENGHYMSIRNTNGSAAAGKNPDTGLAFRCRDNNVVYAQAINHALQTRYGRYVIQFNHGHNNGLFIFNTADRQTAGAQITPSYDAGQTDWQDPTKVIVGSDLGSSSLKWKQIYAANSTISTSDANLKSEITELSDAEKRVAVALKGLVKKFKFNSAIANKGDNARFHVGLIAQEVESAFSAEGLDAREYSLFCEGKWFEYTDAEGVTQRSPIDLPNQDCVEKTQLGIRYEEVLGFIISAL